MRKNNLLLSHKSDARLHRRQTAMLVQYCVPTAVLPNRNMQGQHEQVIAFDILADVPGEGLTNEVGRNTYAITFKQE